MRTKTAHTPLPLRSSINKKFMALVVVGVVAVVVVIIIVCRVVQRHTLPMELYAIRVGYCTTIHYAVLNHMATWRVDRYPGFRNDNRMKRNLRPKRIRKWREKIVSIFNISDKPLWLQFFPFDLYAKLKRAPPFDDNLSSLTRFSSSTPSSAAKLLCERRTLNA